LDVVKDLVSMESGTSKVDDFNGVRLLFDHYVFWLQIAVDQSLAVESSQPLENLPGVLPQAVEIKPLVGLTNQFVE